MYRGRFIVSLAIASFVIFCMGVSELWHCVRTLFPPTTVTYAQAAQPDGLAGMGYVRVTGVTVDPEHLIEIRRTTRSNPRGTFGGLYARVTPEDPAQAGVSCVAAHWSKEPSDDAMDAVTQGSEIVGLVDGPFENLDPKEMNLASSACTCQRERCWVVEVSPPSWTRALLYTGGVWVIPVVWFIGRVRRGAADT